jgi:hypothetical protein
VKVNPAEVQAYVLSVTGKGGTIVGNTAAPAGSDGSGGRTAQPAKNSTSAPTPTPTPTPTPPPVTAMSGCVN